MEAEKAVQALEHGADPQETIDAMSRAIIKQLSADIIKNLRQAALRGEDEVVEAASRLFAQTEGKE
jgi:glutamyl-tRNA reductase